MKKRAGQTTRGPGSTKCLTDKVLSLKRAGIIKNATTVSLQRKIEYLVTLGQVRQKYKDINNKLIILVEGTRLMRGHITNIRGTQNE